MQPELRERDDGMDGGGDPQLETFDTDLAFAERPVMMQTDLECIPTNP